MEEQMNNLARLMRSNTDDCDHCFYRNCNGDCLLPSYETCHTKEDILIISEYIIAAGWHQDRKGEWIFKEYSEDTYTNLTRIYECSLCGRTIECLNEADEPYCHCGAKMTEE